MLSERTRLTGNVYFDGVSDDGSSDDLFQPIGGKDILTMQFTEPAWLVGGLIAAPSVNLLVGDAGTHKSFLAQTLAVCLSSGHDFLKRYRVTKKHRVLYIQSESSKRGFVERIQQIAAGMGVKPGTVDETLATLTNTAFRLDDRRHIAWLAKNQPALVIFDALRDMHTQDENSSEAMKPITDALRLLRDKYSVSSLVLHHTNKSYEYGSGKPGNRTRGSSAIWAAVDGRFTVDVKNGWSEIRSLYLKEHGDDPGFKYRPVFDGGIIRLEGEPFIGKDSSKATAHDAHTSAPIPGFRNEVEGKVLTAFMAAEISTYASLMGATNLSDTGVKTAMRKFGKAGWVDNVAGNSAGGRGKAKRFKPSTTVPPTWKQWIPS